MHDHATGTSPDRHGGSRRRQQRELFARSHHVSSGPRCISSRGFQRISSGNAANFFACGASRSSSSQPISCSGAFRAGGEPGSIAPVWPRCHRSATQRGSEVTNQCRLNLIQHLFASQPCQRGLAPFPPRHGRPATAERWRFTLHRRAVGQGIKPRFLRERRPAPVPIPTATPAVCLQSSASTMVLHFPASRRRLAADRSAAAGVPGAVPSS